MHHHSHTLHPGGAGKAAHVHHPARRSSGLAGATGLPRYIRPILCAGDYWQMQDHRRRFDELGGAGFLRLARLIRVRFRDARIVRPDDLPDDVVSGGALITYAVGRDRPETRRLYHWDYPSRMRGLPAGSLLGITLLGMSVGQRVPLIDGDARVADVRIIAVHDRPIPDLLRCG